jgi:D-alanyl-D-alanine carboxypeptidase/D-alanyl-D-alanine-endopeptidase (penicillin-binding protein 4)
VLRIMDKRSDNFIAEMLAKGLGKDFGAGGTTLAGMAVVRRYLASLGVSLARIRLQDGSGLSYHDRLNTVTITQLLQVESQRSDFNVYLTALPVAGVDGTLGTRMRGTKAARNLRAKTGTLNIASCLSGYVTTVDHHRLAFSILMNGVRLNTWAARQAQDAIGAALAAAHL